MRLVVLGGSGSSTPELIDALDAWPGGLDRRPPLEVVLHSRSADKLAVVADECRTRAARLDGVIVEAELDRGAALAGADVVVNQVRIGGLLARAFDESFPREFGLPGEETLGPGGFANACRTLPALSSLWRDVAAGAPEALVVNLTNPAGMVTQAAAKFRSLRIVAVCDSPSTLCDRIAERLQRQPGRIRRRYVGMNHVGWYVPEDPEELVLLADLATGLSAEDVALYEALPAPYLRYYAHPMEILEGQRNTETRADALLRLEAELLSGYAAAQKELPRRGAVWYARAVLPLIDAWLHGGDEPMIVGLPNHGRIPGLPASVTVEGPVEVRPGQLHPVDPVPLPSLPISLLAQHAAFEDMTVAAIERGSGPVELVRALLANPMVTDVDQARGLVAAILERSPR